MGHAKTILVLFISWYFLGELMTVLKLVGAIAAILGLVLYSHMLSKGS